MHGSRSATLPYPVGFEYLHSPGTDGERQDKGCSGLYMLNSSSSDFDVGVYFSEVLKNIKNTLCHQTLKLTTVYKAMSWL